MKRNATGIAAALALLAVAGSALACGGNPMPESLRSNSAMRARLTAEYVAAHPGSRAARATHIHYGRIMGDWYAVVTFKLDGRSAKPTIFAQHMRDGHIGSWHIARQTRGAVCGRYVPVPLIALWHLDRVHHTDCYVEPAA